MNLLDKTIAVIGLGYVGLPLAVEFAKYHRVIGFDINKTRVQQLVDGVDVTNSVAAEQLHSTSSLLFTSDTNSLKEAEVFIVTVPTPVNALNRPDMWALINASETVGAAMKPGAFVIYESTVYPGATENICVPVLRRSSGLEYNVDFFCGYSPERINPGDQVNTLTKIQKITSGSTTEAAIAIDRLYKRIITAGTHMASSIAVAEAAKVVENTQRDVNIALMNELSLIFSRMDLDTTEVLEAAGTKWNFLKFTPGLVGGHCIGVDPYYLTHRAEELGYASDIIAAGRRVNSSMSHHVAMTVMKRLTKLGCNIRGARVAVLGLTFKENCPDIRNSRVFEIIDELREWGVEILAHDPWVIKSELPSTVRALDLADLTDLDAIIVAVKHDVFKKISLFDMVRACNNKPALLADLKGCYNADVARALGFDVFRL